MSYSHLVPYYLGMSMPGRFGYASAASDAGTEVTTSSGVLVNDDGDMILTPSASSICSASDLGEVQSFGSRTPTVSLSASPTPSITSETATVPAIDIETLLQNKFNNLTLHEKARAFVSVRQFKSSSSCGSGEAEIEMLPENDAAKIGDNGSARAAAPMQDSMTPNLADWQDLCKAVGVTEDKMPVSIAKCKKVLLPSHLPFIHRF